MPRFGEQRRDIFMRAAEDLKADSAVRVVKRPKWGAKYARSAEEVRGVTVDDAPRGRGVWVRVEGAAMVRVRPLGERNAR